MHIYIWCQITHIYHSLLFKKTFFSKKFNPRVYLWGPVSQLSDPTVFNNILITPGIFMYIHSFPIPLSFI